MSMLVPPQMINTMVAVRGRGRCPAAGAAFTQAFYADPVRRYMLPVFSDRRTDWPCHPHATRDSLHEHDMWAVEGLTHRYPTKVLAEMLPTCPQYCGHCTRMDLVGNSTPQVAKLKLDRQAGRPVCRDARLPAATPQVRDVVVSGGDVANMPWKNLEGFLDKLLEVDNIRDIRLATKALMGLPQHWLQPDVVEGVGRVATKAREPRRVAGDPHPRQQRRSRSRPLVADAAQGDARRRRARRAQPGRPHAGRQRLARAAARPVLRALQDDAMITPYYFYMCDMIPFAEHWRLSLARGPAPAARDHGLPARVRHAAHRLRRPVRRQALGAPGRRRTTPSAGCRSGARTTAPRSRAPTTEALSRDYVYYDPIYTLPESGQEWWREQSDLGALDEVAAARAKSSRELAVTQAG